MLDKLKTYLSEVLGINPQIKRDAEGRRKLPLALSQRYSVYVGDVFGQRTCFALDGAGTTPAGYEKEASLMKRALQIPVVIVVEALSPVDVHRLIQKRVDFIVPGKRMFMPSLMIDLGGRYANDDTPDVIPPLAQLIVLFQVQISDLNGLDAKAVAEKFGATYLTASRALKWIGEKIAPLKVEGRRCFLAFPQTKVLFALSKPFLRTPVVKRIPTDERISGLGGVLAGESALEEYSMIVAIGECRAVGRDADICVCEDDRGMNSIEVWMYDPAVMAEDGVCDKISLVLSLSDNTDERIHKEAETLKKELGW